MKAWHSLDEKTIWVVGGAGHLGGAVTEALNTECRKTVCIDLKDRSSEFIKQRGLTKTVAASLDLTETDRLEPFIDATIREHGLPDGVVYLVFASSRGKTLE